jgi:hypothetical protein
MKLTKAEIRENKRNKAKNAPKGATLAGQMNKSKITKKHAKKSKK